MELPLCLSMSRLLLVGTSKCPTRNVRASMASAVHGNASACYFLLRAPQHHLQVRKQAAADADATSASRLRRSATGQSPRSRARRAWRGLHQTSTWSMSTPSRVRAPPTPRVSAVARKNTLLPDLRVGARCGVYDRNNDFGACALTPWPGRPAASTIQELRLLASSGGLTPAGSGLAHARGQGLQHESGITFRVGPYTKLSTGAGRPQACGRWTTCWTRRPTPASTSRTRCPSTWRTNQAFLTRRARPGRRGSLRSAPHDTLLLPPRGQGANLGQGRVRSQGVRR